METPDDLALTPEFAILSRSSVCDGIRLGFLLS
jgi:hypothetical protein